MSGDAAEPNIDASGDTIFITSVASRQVRANLVYSTDIKERLVAEATGTVWFEATGAGNRTLGFWDEDSSGEVIRLEMALDDYIVLHGYSLLVTYNQRSRIAEIVFRSHHRARAFLRQVKSFFGGCRVIPEAEPQNPAAPCWPVLPPDDVKKRRLAIATYELPEEDDLKEPFWYRETSCPQNFAKGKVAKLDPAFDVNAHDYSRFERFDMVIRCIVFGAADGDVVCGRDLQTTEYHDIPDAVALHYVLNDRDIIRALIDLHFDLREISILFEKPYNVPHIFYPYGEGEVSVSRVRMPDWLDLLPLSDIDHPLYDGHLAGLRLTGSIELFWAFGVKSTEKSGTWERYLEPRVIALPVDIFDEPRIRIFTTIALYGKRDKFNDKWRSSEVLVAVTEPPENRLRLYRERPSRWIRMVELSDDFDADRKKWTDFLNSPVSKEAESLVEYAIVVESDRDCEIVAVTGPLSIAMSSPPQ